MTKEEVIILLKCEATNLVGWGASEQDEKKAQLIFDKVNAIDVAIEALEKQIPKKVEWALDSAWGVEKEVPVCPTCDYYLTPIEFIDANICEQTGHREFLKVSYCDHCSQAIDWSDEK